jgi:penicillin-binding protein 1B
VVWVGYDDYSDIRLSGAQTAAPIWAEFMKKAVTLPEFSDVKEFRQPDGVVDVQLDKVTNRLATPTCPDDYTIAFVAGTEPHDTCDQPSSVQGFFSRIFGGGPEKALPPPTTNGAMSGSTISGNQRPAAGVQDQQEAKKKKGFFGKIADAFRGDKKDDDKNTPPASQPASNGNAPPP